MALEMFHGPYRIFLFGQVMSLIILQMVMLVYGLIIKHRLELQQQLQLQTIILVMVRVPLQVLLLMQRHLKVI